MAKRWVDSSRRERIREDWFRLQVVRHTLKDLAPPRRVDFAAFGAGSLIVPPARVSRPQSIDVGAEVRVLEHSFLSVVKVFAAEPRLTIGDRTRIGRFATIACVGSVTIHEEVLTADYVFIGDTSHRYDDPTQSILTQGMVPPRPVVIGPGAFLGIRATVLAGVTVGEHAYVAAGAVVTKDVPDFAIVAGNPAVVVKTIPH